MKYYQVDITIEPEIIGIKNGESQVELLKNEIEKSLNYETFENHFNGNNKDFWQNQNKVFDLKPPILKGRLRKNAKQTDIMEYGPVYSFLYHIYSDKYINVIKPFNIGNFKTFDFKVIGIPEKYFLLFIEAVILEEINFEKSIVTTGFKQLNNIKHHPIENFVDYRNFKYKNPMSTFEVITIPKHYNGRDIIEIQTTTLPFYSEKLIDFLLDCGITGLQIAYNNSIELDFK